MQAHHPARSISIRLSADLQERVQNLVVARQRSSNALVVKEWIDQLRHGKKMEPPKCHI